MNIELIFFNPLSTWLVFNVAPVPPRATTSWWLKINIQCRRDRIFSCSVFLVSRWARSRRNDENLKMMNWFFFLASCKLTLSIFFLISASSTIEWNFHKMHRRAIWCFLCLEFMKTWHASFSGDEQCHKPLLMLLMFLREMRYTARERERRFANGKLFRILYFIYSYLNVITASRTKYVQFRGRGGKNVFNISNFCILSVLFRSKLWNVKHAWHSQRTCQYLRLWIVLGTIFSFQFVENFTEIFHFLSPEILFVMNFVCFPFHSKCWQHSSIRFPILILLRIRGTINQQTESSTHAYFHSLDFRLSTCSSRPPLFSSLLCALCGDISYDFRLLVNSFGDYLAKPKH